MELYEVDVRKYSLQEYLSTYSINTVLGTVLWFLMKVYLIRPQSNPFPLCRSQREQLIDLHEIPERYQTAVSAELKLLKEAGFIETQLIKLPSDSRQPEHKLAGITLMSLHEAKLMGVTVTVYFPDAGEPVRMSYYIVSFPDSVSSITTSNQRNLIDFEPADTASSHPGATLVELIQIHQQRIEDLNRSCLTIDNSEELLQLFEDRANRQLDYNISRGVLKRVGPS
ncbi:hypothetical protein Mal35_46140 [Gimesia maris]|uniref:hypothetical protein n=1 Tax=Gimesia maris TaxID=122 RepID=UPI00118B3984|nr:hypothetical protein [Gimesia maris]QDT81136.1 hypothetical protein Mal35_46140 [Gimesia maris]